MDQSLYAPRVYQLEGAALDSTCKTIFSDLLGRACAPLASYLKIQRPEIELLVEFMYFRLSVAINRPMPSHTIENLGFVRRDGSPLAQKQKLLYLLYIVVGPYASKRLGPYLEAKSIKLVKIIELLFRASQLLYFICFLSKATLPYDPAIWLAGIAIIQPKVGLTRELDFQILNRTVIWDTLGGILQYVLSNQSVKALGKLFLMSSVWGTLQPEDEKGCPVCREQICTMPVTLNPCNHQCCYYCFANANPNKCPRCKAQIASHKM